jgi:hypothetical protein
VVAERECRSRHHKLHPRVSAAEIILAQRAGPSARHGKQKVRGRGVVRGQGGWGLPERVGELEGGQCEGGGGGAAAADVERRGVG